MAKEISDEIVIQVDARESEEFTTCANELGIEAGEPAVSPGLGGIELAEFVFGGASAAAKVISALVKTWIGKRQYMRVVYKDIVYEGYTIKELSPLLEQISEKG